MCGPRLASGGFDGSVKLWGAGAAGALACERELRTGAGAVHALAGWRGKVASGHSDRSIRVWDAATGAHDATLAGHEGPVYALVVHGGRLLSGSWDGTIRAWALGTWAGLQTVEAHGPAPYGQAAGVRCLAVSGSKLVSGSMGVGGVRGEVRVWGLEEVDLRRTLVQPDDSDVSALVAVGGEVWAAVGRNVVVWGRRA
jgi:WD40 repeat protein